jgi:hypothetical protein
MVMRARASSGVIGAIAILGYLTVCGIMCWLN